MKNKILIILSSSLLLLSACKKEDQSDPISESISGHVYEEGTGDPIPGADVFLIAEDYGSWPRTKQMAHAKADQNGAFTIKNIRHPEIYTHYLAAQSSDHYELNSTTDKTRYEAKPSTSKVDILLYRRANLKVRVINTGSGQSISVSSSRQQLTWYQNLIHDTTLNLKVEGFIHNKLSCSSITSGVSKAFDTIYYTEPGRQDTLLLYY